VGQLDVDRLAVGERDPLRLERRGVLERNGKTVGDIRALERPSAALGAEAAEPAASRAAATAPRAAEYAFEDIAEIGPVAAEFERCAARPRAGIEPPGPAAAPAKTEGAARIALLVDLAAVILRALV